MNQNLKIGTLGDSREYPNLWHLHVYYGWLFGIPWARGFHWTRNPKAWGVITGILRAWGKVFRGDWQECECTDSTADDCGKQGLQEEWYCYNLINHACVRIHLQKNTDKIWVVHGVLEADEFLVRLIVYNRRWPAMFRYYTPAIFIICHVGKQSRWKISLKAI